MNKPLPSFNIHKEQLDNGLTVLVRPTQLTPQVEIQLWYNVGSKDEGPAENGMAHLLEHMTFKGTKRLSESDINLITHKLAGYTNAFTSYDFTAYVFKFARNAWHESFALLADCMVNCTYKEDMLASEIPAVVQEMEMYKDEYQGLFVVRRCHSSFFSFTLVSE